MENDVSYSVYNKQLINIATMHSRTYISVILFLSNLLCNSVLSIVVSWGEDCQFTAECGDHRLVCEEVTIDNESAGKVCICDRYHVWNGTSLGCVQKYNVSDILGLLEEKYNVADRIENEANIVFMAQIIAGLIVMGVGFTCSICVAIYCYYMSHQDTKLEEMVKRMESQKGSRNKPTSSRGLT